MNGKILSVVSMFVASFFIGYNLLSPTQKVQATPPVIISPLEFPKKEVMKSVETIDVIVDLETQEVSVKGTTDAIVNVQTTGEVKPIVKWKTRTKEIAVTDTVKTGFPHVKSMRTVSEEPINILDAANNWNNYE